VINLSESEKPVRIGIIGCGQIAQHHMKTYSGIAGAQMVACADISEDATRRASETFGIPNVYSDFHEMLKRDDLDAVDVCLHNNFHCPATVAGLEAGKNVYCEKPMAGSYRDAEAMLDAARRLGKKLHIQLSTLYSDECRAARELIELGELGELYHARSTGHRRRGRPFVDGYGTPTFVQKRNSAGGALYDVGVYHIAQILYLLGNPAVERITGRTYQKIDMDAARKERSGYDVEELGLGFVRLAGGVSVDIIESWALNLGSLGSSCVLGSKGGVSLSPFGFFRSFGNLDIDGTANLGSAHFRWDNVQGDGAYYSDSQRHWIAALQGKVDLLPTAEVALNTMLISEGIYLSEQRGCEVSAAEIREASVSTKVAI
jgi:predicted dehydrogenase